MILVAIYWLLLLTTLGLGWAIGPAETRQAIAAIVTATIATACAQVWLGGELVLAVILGIDALLLAYFIAHSLRSRRFWPMWFSAFCGLGVLSSVAAYIFPREDLAAYQNYAALWAMPALLALLAGTILDRRAKLD